MNAAVTVLLVDDERTFVEVMAKRLARRGFRMLTASGGNEGLERLAAEPGVDVVLLDLKMPDMDGIATLRRIKCDHPLVEVIILTGHGAVEAAEQGMELGAFDFLLKPCDLDDLTAKVLAAKARRQEHADRLCEARVAAAGRQAEKGE